MGSREHDIRAEAVASELIAITGDYFELIGPIAASDLGLHPLEDGDETFAAFREGATRIAARAAALLREARAGSDEHAALASCRSALRVQGLLPAMG